MWTLTRWTRKRLLAQYQRYNRRYWRSELEPYNIKIARCRRCNGFVHHLSSTITIDVARHFSDEDVRLTLLHEMVHVAVFDSPAHSFDFWREVNRILGMGAPAELVNSYARKLRSILRANPGLVDLYYCKMAVRKMEVKRAQERKADRESTFEEKVNKEFEEAVDKFRREAWYATWAQTLTRIGPGTGLICESGRPRSRGAAKALAFIKSIFQRERRQYLRDARRRRARERLRFLLEEK